MKYIALLMCLFGCSLTRKLPSFIEVCKPKHVDVGKCVAKNIENIKPMLASTEGVPELGIPSINPWLVSYADITLGDFIAKFKDVNLHYIYNFDIQKLKMDIKEDVNIDLILKFPKVYAEGKYSMKGKLIILQLEGSGPCSLNTTDLILNIHAVAKRKTKNGKEYLHLDYMDVKHELTDITMNLDNLFPNNKELTDSANNILRQNRAILVEEFASVIKDFMNLKSLISSIMANIFDHYTFDTLFPDD